MSAYDHLSRQELLDLLSATAEAEERYRALTAATFEGIGIHAEGVVLEVNDQMTWMLRGTREQLVGRPVADIVAAESLPIVVEAVRTGRQGPYRFWVNRLDGSKLEVEARARAAEWQGRSVRVAAIRDLTESNRVEARLRTVHKLEALGRLSAGVAHDFNNILAAIVAYADLGAAEADKPELVRQHLADLGVAAGRARELVRQIFTFTQQKAEPREPTELGPVVIQVLKLLRSSLSSMIELDAQIEPAPLVLAAPIQIQQVVMNLCMNGAQAMREHGGKLVVHLGRVDAEPELRDSLPELGSGLYARISVRDSGSGMDPVTLERLFEPFYTTKEEGTGLGLAVVHSIVKAHHGLINVDSQQGRGSKLDVYLPAVEPG
jgi:PAS domain S-box-containing protein